MSEEITEQILNIALQNPYLSEPSVIEEIDNILNITTINRNQCTTSIEINNTPLEALIDSGATHNYISEELCKNLLAHNSPISKNVIKPRNGVVIVGNNQEIQLKGSVDFVVTLQDNDYFTNFHVLGGTMSTPIILGWQGFLIPNKAILNGANETITLPSQKRGALYLHTYVTVPAYSEKLVTASTRYPIESNPTDVYVEKFEPLFKRTGLLISPGLHCVSPGVKDHQINIVLTNMSPKSIRVPTNTVIAIIEPIDSNPLEYCTNIEETSTLINTSKNTIKHKDLNKDQISSFEKFLNDNDDIFTKGTRPSTAHGVTHSIELTSPNNRPISNAPGRPSQEEREIIRKQISEMLHNGIIKESRSPWSSRIVLIKKKDGKPRFCIDYRKLNSITKSDVYPLPRIDDSLAALQKGKFFSTLDMFAGYWQIPMHEKSKEMTAFVSESGLYQFEVMPFGLKTAGATFQRFMDAVLAGLKWKSLLVYLDDIVIFSRTFEEHMKDLSEVFQRLRASGLQLNRSKCHFLKEEFTYLGHIVSEEGIRPDPKKIEAILKMPTPTNQTTTRSLLGSCSYFRKFIPNFAKISAPLYELTKENHRFQWNNEANAALETIKTHLMTHPILHHPNFDYPFIVQVDACDTGLGAVLLQRINGQERIIEWISRTLQPAERHWAVREKEALVIIWSCEIFRPFLVGYKFIVESDHKSLKWLNEATTARLVRWACRLSEFDFEIRYKPGKENTRADMLSRLPQKDSSNRKENFRADNLMFNYDLNPVEQAHVLHSLQPLMYSTPLQTDNYKTCLFICCYGVSLTRY